MSIFSIEMFGVHVLTLVSLAVCFTLTYWKLKVHFVHRIAISGIITILGLWFYDLIWLLSIYNGYIHLPRLLITILFLQILLLYNFFLKSRFLHLNKFFIISLILFFVTIFGMVITGWFVQFNLWAENQTLPNPCNWLWGISKITGLLMWSFLIKQTKQKKKISLNGKQRDLV